MEIKNNRVATILYSVRTMDGSVLEDSDKNGDLSYIHGRGFLSPGMEKALSGKKTGERIDTIIKASDAFGEYEEAMLFNINRNDFTVSDDELKIGLEFQAEIKDDVRFCRVEKIENGMITINANHPYAGLDIRFEAEIKDVRDASPEEIAHGHIHDSSHEGGCGCGHECGDNEYECGCDDSGGCGCDCGHTH